MNLAKILALKETSCIEKDFNDVNKLKIAQRDLEQFKMANYVLF